MSELSEEDKKQASMAEQIRIRISREDSLIDDSPPLPPTPEEIAAEKVNVEKQLEERKKRLREQGLLED